MYSSTQPIKVAFILGRKGGEARRGDLEEIGKTRDWEREKRQMVSLLPHMKVRDKMKRDRSEGLNVRPFNLVFIRTLRFSARKTLS